MLAAVELPPFEILLFIIAALIAVGNRVVDAARKARRKSAEEQRRRDQAEGVQLEESKQPAVKQERLEPRPVAPRPPVTPRPPPLPYPTTQVPPQPGPVPPPPRRHPPRLKLGLTEAPLPTELRRPVKPPPPKWARRRSRKRVHRAAARLRQDPQSLRDAIILREVLGPPVAFRRFGR